MLSHTRNYLHSYQQIYKSVKMRKYVYCASCQPANRSDLPDWPLFDRSILSPQYLQHTRRILGSAKAYINQIDLVLSIPNRDSRETFRIHILGVEGDKYKLGDTRMRRTRYVVDTPFLCQVHKIPATMSSTYIEVCTVSAPIGKPPR